MRYVDNNITNLTKAMGAFVEAEELRDHRGGVGQELSWGDMGRQRGGGLLVFEEGAEQMDEEEVEEHAKII